MVLALVAPFLLGLFRYGSLSGVSGAAGTAAALVILMFYVIFLVRLAPRFTNLTKTAGRVSGRLTGVFYLVYVLGAGAYLLTLLVKIVPENVVSGVTGWVLSLAAILVCGAGTWKGMQGRGRMAEVSGGLLLGSIVLLMVICAGQGKVFQLQEMLVFEPADWARDTYDVLCAFSAVGLLPFVLGDVEKQGSSGKSAALGILTLGGILLAMELLFPAVLGYGRLKETEYPVLPLLAGADLPGNVLARFDVLWIGFLLYSLLFAIGSLLYYGHQIMKCSCLGTGRIWMAAGIWLLSLFGNGSFILKYFPMYLQNIFVPGMLLINVLIFLKGRKKGRSVLAAGTLLLCLLLGGCTPAIEPEKRMYPLALGVDAYGNGLEFTYGMPDLSQSTGQDKAEENSSASVLTVTGGNIGEIEAAYNKTQTKFLDIGHLQVLIVGESILADERWQALLEYLEEEPLAGEDMYVFRAVNAKEIVSWKGQNNSSVGEYLKGMMENRLTGQQKKGVTLREVLNEKYRTGSIPVIPVVSLTGDQLEISQ